MSDLIFQDFLKSKVINLQISQAESRINVLKVTTTKSPC